MSGRASQHDVQHQKRWEPHAEVMVREANHRISNHLQLLVSLIGLQAREHRDAAVREELLQVRRRVLAVARLHAELQRAQEDQTLDIARFLGRIGEDLQTTFTADGQRGAKILFDVDPGQMSSDTAISLALIINELVTNAMKYAVKAAGGEIRVQLKHLIDGTWRLIVSDEGPGLPPHALHSSPSASHGLDMVQLLARKLGGAMRAEPAPRGASISVTFCQS
jgi:two-component sensor histidine kinase